MDAVPELRAGGVDEEDLLDAISLLGAELGPQCISLVPENHSSYMETW